MCAFFPGKKIHKSPVWSMAFPNVSQRSREFKQPKFTWKVTRSGPRIQLSWPTIQRSWSSVCYYWKYLKIKHSKALERKVVESYKLKQSFLVRCPETLSQYKLPWGNGRYYLLTTNLVFQNSKNSHSIDLRVITFLYSPVITKRNMSNTGFKYKSRA